MRTLWSARGLARELGRDAIRVNVIASSAVTTEGASVFRQKAGSRAG
jgi:enoyl-[acyl-carrier-protein] reductase (NADH)